MNDLHLCSSNFCKRQLKFTNTEPHVQSESILLLEGPVSHGCFWGHLGWKTALGGRAASKGTKLLLWEHWLSEIVRKENNRSYSNRLWAQVQTQTIALDQTRALSRNTARFRKKAGCKCRPEHCSSEPVWTQASVLTICCVTSKQDIGKWLKAAAEQAGSFVCWQRGSGSSGCWHLPRALCAQGPLNSHTLANREIPLLGQEAHEPEIAGGNAEGVPQEVLLLLPCSCTLPSQLLLITSGKWTVDQVKLLSTSVWLKCWNTKASFNI